MYGDTIPGVPYTTLWWRQTLYPGPDGYLYAIQLDDPENPTQVTLTWHDSGRDDTIEPYAVRVTEAPEDYDLWSQMYTVRALSERKYLDVLWYAPPTAGRYWVTLTQPGQHVHPNDRQEIMKLRAERIAGMLNRGRNVSADGPPPSP